SERSGVAIGAIHIAEARGENDPGGVMIAAIASEQRREAWQLRERDVDPERAGGAAPSLHAPKKGRIERARRDHRGKRALGIAVGGDRTAADEASILEHDANRPALLDQDLANGRIGLDLHAIAGGGARHGLGDRTHSPDGMTPKTLLAVHLAEGV